MTDINSLIKTLSNLTVMEAADLASELEKAWGVSAAAPTAAAAPVAAAAPAAEEKSSFTVHLASFEADKKISVIKEVRTITGLGLSEAKALVESAPKTVKEGVSKDEAEKMKETLEKAGAKVELK